MGNLAEYIARSYVIRDATEDGENTADRIGSAFLNGGDVFTSILLVKSNNGRMMTSRDDAIVALNNTITFGTGWDMFHGSGYFMAGGNVVVPQTVTVGAASGVVYLDVTDNLFKWASTTELLAEKAIIVAHTKDDAIVEVFANRYLLDGKVCGNGVGSGTDMATVWASLADNGNQQINVSHLRDALGGCTWWGSGMSGGAVTGSLSDVLNITMTGRISINGFVIEYDAENNALRFNGSIYATGSVSALGYQSGGGGGGSSTLADLFDVQLTTPIGDGDVLTYDTALGKWTNGTGGGTGSVTSVGMTTPTGLLVNNAHSATITSSGTFALSLVDGFTIPATDDVSKGVTAYGWGNHATQGYATQAWVTSQGYTANAGTVTSVGLSVPTGFSVTGSPVTSSGTLTLKFASDYSLPTNTRQSQWDDAYGWGNHANAGYATQSALASAVSRIGTLEGYFTNGVANQAARLSGSTTYQAWGQEYWRNGQPLSISGRLSSVTDIMMTGSVNVSGDGGLNYIVGQNYISAILRNSTYNQLVIGYGTSQNGYNLYLEGKDVEARLWDADNATFKTPLAMSLDGNNDPYVQVDKTLRIGDGNGHYFPVTYDYANNALCFSGHIYATGGVSALGFSSTQNGGALINGTLAVQSTATVSGNTSIGGTLSVAGATTLADALTVGELATFSKGITSKLLTTVAQLRATGAVTCSSSLTVSGMVSVGGRFVIDNDADDIAIVWNGREYYLDVQEMINNGFLT